MMNLEIKGFLETSFLDWDGKVVSTLFLPRCNFRCPFCHNSDLIENPQKIENVPLDRVESFLLRQKDFIDGICLTGGEPNLHDLSGFLKRIKSFGFKIKIDTNGSNPEAIQKQIEAKLVDYVAIDIKGPLDERYDKLSGIKTDLDKIKKSVRLVMDKGIEHEFRTTVVPSLLDTGDIKHIAEFIAGAKKFVLQQFVAEHCWDKSLRSVKPYPRKKLEEMIEVSKAFVANTSIRGA